MSDGGFKFAKVTITADSSIYTDVSLWCLAVHKTRCEAFLRATERENGHWTSIQTSLSNESTIPVNYDDTNTYSVYYAPTTSSTDYPGYISYFKDTDTDMEYSLATSYGYNVNSSYASSYSYISPYRANQLGGSKASSYNLPSTCGHAIAMNGFKSYDITNMYMNTDELPFTPQYGISRVVGISDGNFSGVGSTIGYRTSSGNYTYGFAVKENVILSFYQYNSGNIFWSIAGEIFNSDCIGGHPYGIICCPCSEVSDTATNISTQKWIDDYYSFLTVSDYEGNAYPTYDIKVNTSNKITARCMPSYISARANATVPTNLYYGNLCCAFNLSSNYSIPGIDADGNLCKGYIRSDILRVVSHRLCTSPGSLFQSGNFISLGSTASDAGVLGILLGWDSSNSSLM